MSDIQERGPWGPPAPLEPTRLYAYAPEDEAVHLRDHLRVLRRHRWTIATFFVVTVVTAALWVFTTRPVYTASTTLRIEREAPKVLKFDDVVQSEAEDEYYQTQYKVLQSWTLADRVIATLALDQHPDFADLDDEGLLTRARAWAREQTVRWLPVSAPPDTGSADDLVAESPLARDFADRLTVKPVRNARLVEVSFESHYPDLSARVANTLADAFIAQNLDQKVEATRYASRFLAQQMEEARGRLESSEARLNAFLQRNEVLFLSTDDRSGDRQDLVTRQLAVLSDALLKARATRMEKEAAIALGSGEAFDTLPAVLSNLVVGALKEQLVALEGEYRKLAETFKEDYPRMRRLEQNVAEVRRQIEAETQRIVEGLQTEYLAALRAEHEMQKALDEHKGLALALGSRMAEYRFLRRDVDTNQGLYTTLLTRLKETSVSSSLLASNIVVVDRARVPLDPSKPKKLLTLLVASFVGLFGGVGLAFFREYLDTTIKDAREVETALHLPTLAMVPAQEAVERQRSRRRALEQGEPAPFALVAHADVASVLAEAFRNLRTSLLYSSPDHPPRTLMFTSLAPGDGKTSLATNLAIVLAQLGVGDVLLVDGDMRKPRLHEVLEVPQAPGLSTFLTGQATIEEVVKPTRIPGLSVVPCGLVPVNPAELLSSARLPKALEDLGRRFAHVVFDAPPLFGVSDATVLAPKVEGVVLVLRHGRSSRDAAQRAVAHLASVHSRLLGVILNDVDVQTQGYYGYGYYGYGPRVAKPDAADTAGV